MSNIYLVSYGDYTCVSCIISERQPYKEKLWIFLSQPACGSTYCSFPSLLRVCTRVWQTDRQRNGHAADEQVDTENSYCTYRACMQCVARQKLGMLWNNWQVPLWFNASCVEYSTNSSTGPQCQDVFITSITTPSTPLVDTTAKFITRKITLCLKKTFHL